MASYTGTHNKLLRERGPATEHLCRCGCGRYATDWAYTHLATDELTQVRVSFGAYPYVHKYPYEVPFSEDVYNDYIPLHRECHRRLDAIHKNPGYNIYDEDESGMWLL